MVKYVSPADELSWAERLKRWWRQLWQTTQPSAGSSSQTSPSVVPQQAGANQPRYAVQAANGQEASEHDSLSEAHEAWKRQTDSNGRIIDRRTGRDITPAPDNDGRYVVLDKGDQQVGSFDDLQAALEAWREVTGEQGRVVDVKRKKDITPRDSKLSQEQLEVLQGMFAGKGAASHQVLGIDPDTVASLIEQISRLPVPVFDRVNYDGRGKKQPTRTVPITRRKVEIVKVRRKVPVEVQGPRRPGGRIFVPYPTEEPELTQMRSMTDLRRVPRGAFNVPPALLRRRIARKQLPVKTYVEEVPGPPTVKKRLMWQEFEEPKVNEWTEQVEVTEDEKAQLLEAILDVSGSMDGNKVQIAVALMSTIVGAHLDDDSRYLFRRFANEVGDATDADTPALKRKLITGLLDQEHYLGGGTEILLALETAARDVKRRAKRGQTPEILLISDGDDSFTSAELYRILGNDIVLHTVLVNGHNPDLKARSTTYYELWWFGYDGEALEGSDGSAGSAYGRHFGNYDAW